MKIVAAVLLGVGMFVLMFFVSYLMAELTVLLTSQAPEPPATIELVPVVRVFHL